MTGFCRNVPAWQHASQGPPSATDGPRVELFRNFWNPSDEVAEALAGHRLRIAKVLSAVGALALASLAVAHATVGAWPLMILNTVLSLLLGSTAWNLHRQRPPWVPFLALFLGLIAALAYSIYLQGFLGVLWSFPAMFLSHFILPPRQARPLSVLLLLTVSVSSFVSLGPFVTLRVVLSLGFVLLMIHVVLQVLGELQRAMVAQAITDPLTGSYNRRHLQTQLDRLAAPGDSAQRPGPALLAIDVDHFKAINDKHGHDAGDRVLQQLVAQIKARQRLGDLLFRTGGEEFMLLLPRTRPADAVRLAEDLRRRIEATELLPGARVTVSIGVSGLLPSTPIADWLKSADRALYAAKQGGRNRVEPALE